MKKRTFPSILLKTTVLLFFGLVTAISLSSFSSQKMTDDLWKILGITKQAGSEKIKNSFMNEYLDHYGMKNLKNIALNNRAAVAKDLLVFTKQYISSAAFVKNYEQLRSDAKPQEPVLKPLRTIEQIQKEEIAKTEKSIKDGEKTIKDMPDMAKVMQPLMEVLKKTLKEYQDPKNKYFIAIAQGEKYEQENEIKRFREKTKQWEEWYPASANQFIAGKLQKMLDATKDIDYNAELVEKYGKKRFVNSAYEYKNASWKQGYRAGKDVTETARAFAKQWLVELSNK
jgi:hypothetical protein